MSSSVSRKLTAAPIASLLSIVILTPSLKSCDEASFKTYICPQLKRYSSEFQLKVADELKTAGPNTKILLSDYGQLRDACRALEAVK